MSDRAIDEALYDWWFRFKRNHDKTPTPAQSFEAGFKAARAIYIAHAEEAIRDLNAIQRRADVPRAVEPAE